MEFMFLPLKRYADFSGRSRRMEFWMWMLFQFLVGCAFLVAAIGLVSFAFRPGERSFPIDGAALALVLIWGLVSLAFLVPNLAVTVRRLHDTDRSGWWIMLYGGPALASNFLAPVMMTGDNLEAATGIALLLSAASLVGGLVLLAFLFLDGTPGRNRFGLDPKGRADAGNVFA